MSPPASVQRIPLTKILVPQLIRDALPRRNLIVSLHHSMSTNRLTLLSASAGAGKTTAVLAVHAANPELKIAWLSIDEGDNDAYTFLRLMVAALQLLVPDIASQASRSLEMGDAGNVPPLTVASMLVNDLATHFTELTIIVFDDLHRVSDERIFQIIDYLLERSPAHIHFVVTTRQDPSLRLSHLLAAGNMEEFRTDRLMFSAEDVSTLLNEIIDLQLTAADVRHIVDRTEGWAAGIRLLALSLQSLEPGQARSSWIENLSASQRFLFDYLVEEVIGHLDPDLRDFMLQTSILDELTPSVCNAVTVRSDSEIVLDELYRKNLFLTLEEGSGLAEPSYRTHALFAQFLQKELRLKAPALIPELHLRAAGVARFPEQRIRHLLAAQAWDAVIPEITAIGKQQSVHGYISPQTIDWIDRIPVSLREKHYWLDLIRSSFLRQKGRLQESWALAKPALAQAEKAGDIDGRLEALWTLGFYGTEQRDVQWRKRLIELAARYPDHIFPIRRAHFSLSKAWLAQDWEQTGQFVREFIDLARQANPEDRYHMTAQHVGAQFLFIDGGMNLLDAFDRENAHLLGDEEGLPKLGALARGAWVALLQGRLSEAETLHQHARRSLAFFGSFAFLDLTLDWLLLNLMNVKGEYRRLEEFVREAVPRLEAADTHRRSIPSYKMALWRGVWSQDLIDKSRGIREDLIGLLDEKNLRLSPAPPIIEGWGLYASKKFSAAEDKFIEAVRRHEELRWIGTWGNAGMDLAVFYLQQNRKEEALRAWRRTAQELIAREMPGQPLITGPKAIPLLQLAVKQSVYPDVAQVSLAAFEASRGPHTIAIPGSAETLTPREAEVLQLLVSGSSNQEIARRLVVTTRTAKAHVSNILHKLQVSSRAEAIARAHELSLL